LIKQSQMIALPLHGTDGVEVFVGCCQSPLSGHRRRLSSSKSELFNCTYPPGTQRMPDFQEASGMTSQMIT
jgi:hypothetical protein